MTGGFMFNASYTLLDQKSNAPDTGASSLGGTNYNQFAPNGDYGEDGYVSRHRFVSYGVFDTPFGRGPKIRIRHAGLVGYRDREMGNVVADVRQERDCVHPSVRM
jgi:hypothetical protein